MLIQFLLYMKNKSFSYLSLGSNMNNPYLNLNQALEYLSRDVKIVEKSSFYESEPLYYTKQKLFLNMVVKISTNHTFISLLSFLKNIELKMGRKFNAFRYHERIIDLDILTFNNVIYSDDLITIPHPKIHERKFVLLPWCEISPNYFLVNYQKNITTLLSCTKDNSKVIKL